MHAAGRWIAVWCMAVLLTACESFALRLPSTVEQVPSAGTGGFLLRGIPYRNLPGWRGENHSEILPVLLKSCALLKEQPPDKAVGDLPEMGVVSDWVKICDDAAVIRPGNNTEAQYFFESRFIAYTVIYDGGADGLITGYYEPEVAGSWSPDQKYRYPLYSLPKDLVSADLGEFDDKFKGEQIAGRFAEERLVPYFSRAEIDGGALAGRQLEILWAESDIDTFFMHIQGSGRIRLPDGSHVRLGYAGRNGRRYTAVGRELVAAGVMRLRDVTMPAIRRWMEQNPVAAKGVMQRNKSYVFFRVLKGEGPVGAQGVVLTPERSLAVDPRYVPLGAPVWLDTTVPGTGRPAERLRRIVVAQDTGSAIKGAVRGDLYWGHGKRAGAMAGIMKQQGRLHVFLPRAAADRVAAAQQ